jgi:hypothetical protein
MDFNAFSHGQVQSKLWLCDNLENYITEPVTIAILGCWYNVLGLMLCLRNSEKIKSIRGIDNDQNAINLANSFCQSFMIQPNVKIDHTLADANELDYNGYDIVINTSVEHMVSTEWFNKVSKNSLVCIQSSNVVTEDPLWDIKNPNPNIDTLTYKFPMSNLYVRKTYHFQYESFGYDRFMLIGRK